MMFRAVFADMLQINQTMASPCDTKGWNFKMVPKIIIIHGRSIPKANVGNSALVVHKEGFKLLQLGGRDISPNRTSIHQPGRNETVVKLEPSFLWDGSVQKQGTLRLIIPQRVQRMGGSSGWDIFARRPNVDHNGCTIGS